MMTRAEKLLSRAINGRSRSVRIRVRGKEQDIVMERGIAIPERIRRGRGPSKLMKAISSMEMFEESFLYTAYASSIRATAKRAGFKVRLCPTKSNARELSSEGQEMKQEYRIWKVGIVS